MDKHKPVIINMFSKIAHRYDLANRLMTGGLDVYWRWRMARLLRGKKIRTVGDFATGSGDVAFSLAKYLPEDHEELTIIGIDFCEPMLEKAREKLSLQQFPANIHLQFITGDCLNPPFVEGSLDAITIAFGIRNFENLDQGLAAMYEVLKPGGRLVILEASVASPWFRPFYSLYVRYFMPLVAKWIVGDRQAYTYLGDSIAAFPKPRALVEKLKSIGFKEASFESLCFGVSTLYLAVK